MPTGIYIRKTGRTEIVCKFCGNKKSLQTYLAKGTPAKARQYYCSQSCYWKDMKGKDPKHLPNYKGTIAWNKGKKMPELTGENSLFWKGGFSIEPYGREFSKQLKESIRERDNYRCQECFRHQDELFGNTKVGMRPRKLYIHHIDYDKKNNNPLNLISLCLSCHVQTNWNRNNWENYYKNKNMRVGGV